MVILGEYLTCLASLVYEYNANATGATTQGQGLHRSAVCATIITPTADEGESTMRTEAFSLVGLDPNDVEGLELRWNDWVRGLFEQGFRPGEEPVSWDDSQVVYHLVPVGALNDFNRTLVAEAVA